MNEQMNRDTRRAADRTRTDTERASNRGIEFNDESKLGSSPTITERELANRLTDTMSGRDDPFYKFPPEEPTNNDPCDWGVHDEGSNALPSGGGGGVPSGYEETAFTMCVNGSPVPGTILFKAD